MKRPAIPAEAARAVLIEAGHRCAVCGVPCPLERAHIVSWRESRDHSVENLICLCANCHEMADRDKWGEKTLREYKARPWVNRQNSTHRETNSFALVQIVIRKEMREFDDHQIDILRYGLARFLDTDPKAIKIVARRRGSVKVILELPLEVAAELRDRFQKARESIQDNLPIFPIETIEAVLSGEIALTAIEGTPAEDELLDLARKAIERLPARHREVLYRIFEELNLEDEESSEFRARKHQALKALRKEMQRLGGQINKGT